MTTSPAVTVDCVSCWCDFSTPGPFRTSTQNWIFVLASTLKFTFPRNRSPFQQLESFVHDTIDGKICLCVMMIFERKREKKRNDQAGDCLAWESHLQLAVVGGWLSCLALPFRRFRWPRDRATLRLIHPQHARISQIQTIHRKRKYLWLQQANPTFLPLKCY